ncbi:MAG: 2-iminoacetate synthase ThiH [Deltaproteobacteria bacterium]|nr:2-iminoacetate synthase ThiH [Deltaproteobacteria bacterium]
MQEFKKFSELFQPAIADSINSKLQSSHVDIPSILAKEKLDFDDFIALLSPAAEKYLEQLAQRSHEISLRRFGKNISLYAPLYVSNECINTCTYCGYSRPNQIKRRTLTVDQVRKDAEALRASGIRNVLLLTGEHPKKNPIPYLIDCVKAMRPIFDSVQMEIYPVEVNEYHNFLAAGIEGVTVYQETYNRAVYDQVHVAGFKKDFDYRLDTPDRISEAGIRKIAIGALLGLSPWRFELAALGMHLKYLEKRAYTSALSVSFPRIREAAFYLPPEHNVSDKEFVQIICAFRIFSPDVGINISTREEQVFRDELIPLGVTAMSAGSRTDVGGYSGPSESTEQFALEDIRSPEEVASAIRAKGYQPMYKDWDRLIEAA